MDEKGNYKRVKVTTYNYPMLTDETFGLSLIGLKKQLNRELESVRDELTAFNATHKIDYELPEGILQDRYAVNVFSSGGKYAWFDKSFKSLDSKIY